MAMYNRTNLVAHEYQYPRQLSDSRVGFIGFLYDADHFDRHYTFNAHSGDPTTDLIANSKLVHTMDCPETAGHFYITGGKGAITNIRIYLCDANVRDFQEHSRESFRDAMLRMCNRLMY